MSYLDVMSNYEVSDVEELLDNLGEMDVVLETGIEYELHSHNTKFDEPSDGFIETEGILDGEYKVVQFPASAIEHITYHKTL